MLILVVRTLILYGMVIAAMRIMGKRQLGELQPSELVVAIMISDLASVPMQAIDIPLLTGIIPVLTLIVAEVMMSYLSLKSKNIRKFLSGEPSIVVYDGCINEAELKNFGSISMICLRNFDLTVVTIYPMWRWRFWKQAVN